VNKHDLTYVLLKTSIANNKTDLQRSEIMKKTGYRQQVGAQNVFNQNADTYDYRHDMCYLYIQAAVLVFRQA